MGFFFFLYFLDFRSDPEPDPHQGSRPTRIRIPILIKLMRIHITALEIAKPIHNKDPGSKTIVLDLYFFIRIQIYTLIYILDPEPYGYWSGSTAIVGQIPTGHLTTISVYSAKVNIKMAILSNYFGKNLRCTLLKYWMKKCKFLIYKVTKSWVASKFTA